MLGRTLDELPPQTRKLLTSLHGWGDTQLKIHLARLAELEYVLAHRVSRGQGFEYELVYEGEGERGGCFLMGLADLLRLHGEGLAYNGERSGGSDERSAPGRGMVGGRGGEIALHANNGGLSVESADAGAQNAHPTHVAANGSYPQPVLADSEA